MYLCLKDLLSYYRFKCGIGYLIKSKHSMGAVARCPTQQSNSSDSKCIPMRPNKFYDYLFMVCVTLSKVRDSTFTSAAGLSADFAIEFSCKSRPHKITPVVQFHSKNFFQKRTFQAQLQDILKYLNRHYRNKIF